MRPPDKPTPDEVDAIAEAERLSPRTVVRAFESPELVKDETRQRVFRSREELGFGRAPDAIFGLLVPDDTNPFFAQLKKSLETRLAQTNFLLWAASSYGFEQREHGILQSWIAMRVAGVFYAQNPPFLESLERLSRATDVSVVLVDVDPAGIDQPLPVKDVVLANNAAGIELAVGHLVLEHGHQRVAFLSGPVWASTAKARERAFDTAIRGHGLDPENCPHLVGDYTFESGRAAANELAKLRRKNPHGSPTAVVAANDLMAFGVIKGLSRVQTPNGDRYEVPADFSVIGFDNLKECDWLDPEVTSIDQRVDEIAERAVRVMTNKIFPTPADRHVGDDETKPDLVAPVLKERKSVAGPPGIE
ncbi:MAG TPA: LacI family DNA-binding transcriptional regulator [Actinomycetota bacterium]|jgi:DNA-binding LacI/PurR family transcriptional regulator